MLLKLREDFKDYISYNLPFMVNRSLIFKLNNRIKYYPIQFMNDEFIVYEGNIIDYDTIEIDIRYIDENRLETDTSEITRFVVEITEEYNHPKYIMKFIKLDTKRMKNTDIDLFKKFHKMIANPGRKISENLCVYNIKDVKFNDLGIYEIIYFMDDTRVYENYDNPTLNLIVQDDIIHLNDYIV